MNKILLLFYKLVLLFILVFGTVASVCFWNSYRKEAFENAYSASIIEKYDRLKALKSPKIVLIAGSNFAYGINSEMIEKQLRMPTVNMAIHYNFGSDFMLRSLENELHSGDVVIMGFEYIVESKGNMSEKIEMAYYFPPAAQWIVYKNIEENIADHCIFYINQFRVTCQRFMNERQSLPSVADTTSTFFRKAFNKYGDLISHLNNPPLKHLPPAIISEARSIDQPLEDMNAFSKKMKAKGVKVFYIYPPYAASNFKADEKIIREMESKFESKATFSILGKPQDFAYPDTLFQDNAYHLNTKGRDIRTQTLIDLLKKTP